ncbi:MAG: isoleucine--tRNA ligase [Verrucomicrobiota bacterium]
MDYKSTIRLPQTAFPMRAELPKREPIFLKLWEDTRVYEEILKEHKNDPLFILHDGPPFANGDAHIGHALNMTLKDIVLKSKNMDGKLSPFVPGWDCHGLPIEHKVVQELEKSGKAKKGQKYDAADIRTKCDAYARKYIDIQRTQFKRLGVFGDWENPYLTIAPQFEAEILRGLAVMVDKNLIYQGMRPVLWSTGCQTALAEAEVEYMDRTDTSVDTRFTLTQDSLKKLSLPENSKAHLLIWTTTPWTLPANLAVAAHPTMTYVIAESEGEIFICAESLLASVASKGKRELKIQRTLKGSELEGISYEHPFLKRIGNVYTADFVTSDTGTGLVHIAPGHGYDDYELGMRHKMELLSPVDENGRLTEECGVPEITGMYVFDANLKVVELLKKVGKLWCTEEFSHSYPHCWRSKAPIIFRCVKQWFIRIDAIRQKALDAIDHVKWVPAWGMNRIRGAVESRPDWCISRQRTWGVPIPVFYDAQEKPVLQSDVIRKFADIVEKEGTNVWFEDEKIGTRLGLPANLKKGIDTLDVWIDSGTSHTAVLKQRSDMRFPYDMYLEGSDQHRGWFQSSLLVSIALHDAPPYKEVLTNGFVVDLDGKKLSKSNVGQKPAGLMDFVDKYGADILRLWVSSQDYRDDVPFSEEIFTRVADTYRLFRNTLRILLGNLGDFNPSTDKIPEKEWTELDLYVAARLQDVTAATVKAYETYEFHQVYHIINRFCSVELSALYIDVLKDRLYCGAENDEKRRAAQTVMYEIVETLCKLLAPLTPFTAEEAWQSLADKTWNGQKFVRPSVHTLRFPKVREVTYPVGFSKETFIDRWEKILNLRAKVNEQLEPMRQSKTIGKSLEAAVELSAPFVKPGDAELLEELLIVSRVTSATSDEIKINVQKADGKKCVRCWKISETLGAHPAHPELCPRCTDVVEDNILV